MHTPGSPPQLEKIGELVTPISPDRGHSVIVVEPGARLQLNQDLGAFTARITWAKAGNETPTVLVTNVVTQPQREGPGRYYIPKETHVALEAQGTKEPVREVLLASYTQLFTNHVPKLAKAPQPRLELGAPILEGSSNPIRHHTQFEPTMDPFHPTDHDNDALADLFRKGDYPQELLAISIRHAAGLLILKNTSPDPLGITIPRT